MKTKTTKQIIADVKTSKNHVFVKRDASGHKLLTLSFRPQKGFRYFKSSRPGGGGRKHTACTEAQAIKYLQEIGY